jgi:hypothetical protein
MNYQSEGNPTSYFTENLDKLMQQAQRQKVMLISDTAGLGKSRSNKIFHLTGWSGLI